MQGVTIDFNANIARWTNSIDKMTNDLSKFQSHSERVSGNISRVFGALGIGFSAGYFASLIKGAIDAADHLNDLSKSTNIAIADLAGLKLLANQTGTDLDGLAKGVNKMSVEMGKAPEKFKALGITAKDNTHAFAQFADIFNLLPDINQRNALAMAAFGKSWAEMAPALSEGGSKILETIEKGKRLSGMTQEMGVNADHFNDQLAELKMTLGATSTKLVSDALPAMNKIAEAMREAAKEGNLLTVALVGVGGALAGIFTDDNMTRAQQIAKELQHLREENATAQKWGGPLAWISDAMKDKLNTELNARNQRMIALQKELQAIQNLDAAKNKSNFTEEQAMALAKQKYDASLRAAAFLGEQADAYDKVQKRAEDYIKTLQKETAQAGLDEIQKKMVEASIVSLTLHTVKEREAVMAAALAWADATRIGNEAKLAKEAQIKAAEDFLKAQQELVIGLNREAVSLREKADAAEEENARIGKTAEQLAALTIARYDEQIALANAAKAAVPANAGRDAEIVLIEQQIDALNRLKNAAGQHAVLQKQADDLKKLSDDWKKFTDDIERSLTDALMRGFERGESFGQNFVNSLKHTLETAALKIVVQAIVDPVMGGVKSLAGGGSFMEGMGSASNLFGIGNMGNAGGIANTIGFATGGYTSAYGGMAGMAGDTAIMASTAGEAAGTAATSSMMSAVSTAMPYLAAAYAAYSIITQDHGTPTSNLGSANTSFNASGQPTGSLTYLNSLSTPLTTGMIAGMQASYQSIAKTLGIGAVATQFGYSANTGANGQSPNFGLYGGAGSRVFNQTETPASDAAVQLAASRAVFTALQGSKLPEYLRKLFSVDAGILSQQQITDTLALANSLKQVRDALKETRTPLEILTQNVLDGEKAFKTTAETFKEDFIKAIDKGMGAAKLKQWQDLGAAIDQLAAVDAQKAADNAAKAAEAATKLASAAADLANQKRSLEIQLMDAQGNSIAALTARRMDELAALDASLKPLQEQIYATQDKAIADALAADTAAKAADTAAKAADAQQRAIADATRAAQQFADAWKSVTDAIFAEVDRIRGESASGSLAQFATLTAQARAGDIEAAKMLPTTAQSVLAAAEAIASSALDIARLRGQVAGSLETTALGLSPTTNVSLSPTISGSKVIATANADLIAEVRALKAEVVQLRQENQSGQVAIAGNTLKTSKILIQWDGDGMPAVRV